MLPLLVNKNEYYNNNQLYNRTLYYVIEHIPAENAGTEVSLAPIYCLVFIPARPNFCIDLREYRPFRNFGVEKHRIETIISKNMPQNSKRCFVVLKTLCILSIKYTQKF